MRFFIYDSAGPTLKLQPFAFDAPCNYKYEKILTASDAGVRILFSGLDGKPRHPDLGMANQTNSSFIITQETIIRNTTNSVINGVIFEASFNCTLYDDFGNFKIRTNGIYRYYNWVLQCTVIALHNGLLSH